MSEALDPRDVAAELLAAARTNDHAGFSKQLGWLASEIESHVRIVAKRNARLIARVPTLTEDDVVQEVFQRLLKTPPTGEATNPLALVLAWAGTTTMRFLLDEATRPSTARRQTSIEPDAERGDASSPLETIERPDVDHRRHEDPSQSVEARSELANVRRVLAERYPRGLKLLEAELANLDEPDGVLATALGTSEANIQQIRHRRLRVLADDLSGRERDGRP